MNSSSELSYLSWCPLMPPSGCIFSLTMRGGDSLAGITVSSGETWRISRFQVVSPGLYVFLISAKWYMQEAGHLLDASWKMEESKNSCECRASGDARDRALRRMDHERVLLRSSYLCKACFVCMCLGGTGCFSGLIQPYPDYWECLVGHLCWSWT